MLAKGQEMAKQSGIPWIERFVGKMLISSWCRKHPPGETLSLLRTQQAELVSLMDAAGARATHRVQVKRMPGLEASSTNYSLAMVADHLARVNRGIAATLDSLIANRRHEEVVVIAAYKPDPSALPAPALADLDASIAALVRPLDDQDGIRQSGMTHAHPWFGELPATTWACFPAFHQAIHLKQARAISAGL